MTIGRMLAPVLAVSISLGFMGAAAAREAENCATPESGLTGTLTAWSGEKAKAVTAHNAGDVNRTVIEVGKRTSLTMAARGGVQFVLPPEQKDMPAQYVYSAMASFRVPEAGTYSVVLSEGMWIDIVQNGALAKSTTFGRGPACTTIGKKVEFPLPAGDAVLQLFGAPYATVDVLIVKAN